MADDGGTVLPFGGQQFPQLVEVVRAKIGLDVRYGNIEFTQEINDFHVQILIVAEVTVAVIGDVIRDQEAHFHIVKHSLFGDSKQARQLPSGIIEFSIFD